MLSKDELKLLSDKIVKLINAEKVILFGSYASGKSDEQSDIDLCIITNEKRRKLDIMRELRKNLSSDIDYPLDLLVYNEDEFYEKANLENSFEHQIADKGAYLYG